ncbi:MAG: methyltransferase domain-containing protein [Phycisphaeraceae bacterium]
MVERNTFSDGTLYCGWAIHAQRYEFAARYCVDQRVFDAGCGIGYGSHLLSRHGATEVYGVDYSAEAITEARQTYPTDKLHFIEGNLEDLDAVEGLPGTFDVLVNIENLEHLFHPTQFLDAAVARLQSSGRVQAIITTPNGALTERDKSGRIRNEFHVREYRETEFSELVGQYFENHDLFGQWDRPESYARLDRERRLFEQLSGFYYNPLLRLGRLVTRGLGRTPPPPPRFTAAGETYPWEYEIQPLADAPFPWQPKYLIAVCRGPKS